MSKKLCKPEGVLVYFTQRNNKFKPSVSCFRESITMAMVNNGIEIQSPTIRRMIREFDAGDLLAGLHMAEYNTTKNVYSWNHNQEVVRKLFNCVVSFNSESEKYVRWYNSATIDTIKAEIDNGYMVVLGTHKLGGLKGGHIVCVCGYDDNNFYLMDPYGDYRTGYSSGSSGKMVPIPFDHDGLDLESKGVPEGRYRIMKIHADKEHEV